MKKLIFPAILLFSATFLKAQFYYNDILGTQKTSAQFKLYKLHSINTVNAKSFESDGEESKDFFLQQNIDLSKKLIETKSGAVSSASSNLSSYFNENGDLIKTVDENDISENTSTYTYNDKDQLISIETNAVTADNSFKQTEKHVWFYNSNGKAEKMLKIKNDKDTITVRVNYNENADATEEVSFTKGKQIDRFYFYYNAKNQLSDIVRYNSRYQKMLPDYSFDYDAMGRLNEMTVYRVQSSGSDYLTWMYLYDERGLKIKEACVDKDKRLVGKIEYSYNGKVQAANN